MVLFVFVIMILNKEEEEPWALRGWLGKTIAAAALTYFLTRLVQVLWKVGESPIVAEKLWKAGELARYGTTKEVGKQLFTTYLFPFEAISIALLIAIVGAVVLAHPEHATEGGGHARGPAGSGPGAA
jgi:NADH-quinone oxidoreductase subunit J